MSGWGVRQVECHLPSPLGLAYSPWDYKLIRKFWLPKGLIDGRSDAKDTGSGLSSRMFSLSRRRRIVKLPYQRRLRTYLSHLDFLCS